MLTILIKPHLGYVAALQEAYIIITQIFFTKTVHGNYLGLIFGVPSSEWRCASFSIRLDFWVCEDVVAGRNHRFLLIPNELSQDKFE